MAKKKNEEVIIHNCKECNESLIIDDKLYCKMRLKNLFETSDYALTDKKENCSYYRKKK